MVLLWFLCIALSLALTYQIVTPASSLARNASHHSLKNYIVHEVIEQTIFVRNEWFITQTFSATMQITEY